MFNKKLAIDLGTSNSRVVLSDKGKVVEEPTVVAYSVDDKKVLAIGSEAQNMLGKVPGNTVARRPLKHGVIAYYKLTEAYLKRLLDKAIGKSRIFKPDVMVSVPVDITSVEERAVIDAVTSAGAGKVYLIPEAIAAALGSDMPIHTSSGNMIVNIGGGTSEIAILSLNGIVKAKSERVGGDDLNEAIINFIRKDKGILIGEQMAESIKRQIGTAVRVDQKKKMEVRGRDLSLGLPNSAIVTNFELVTPIKTVLNKVIYGVKEILEKTPPELSSDIIDNGIVLSGGSARLKGIEELFTRAVGVPVHVNEDPMGAVVSGIYKALEHIDEIKKSLK
jgi:rod shape-determining protein MreB